MTKIERTKLQRILQIGAQMANTCYNLSQRDGKLSKHERETMATLVRHWDAAHWDGTTQRTEIAKDKSHD